MYELTLRNYYSMWPGDGHFESHADWFGSFHPLPCKMWAQDVCLLVN